MSAGKSFVRLLLIFSALLIFCACPNRARHHQNPDEKVTSSDVEFVVTRENRENVTLGARIISTQGGARPAIIFLPGGGRVSREGLRKGDGTREYASALKVTDAMAMHFAKAGYLSFAYDKRTCTPNDDALCLRAESDDLDEQGPSALAKDLDAACAMVKAHPQYEGRLILYAHGQGTQVALSSSCANEADVVILSAMIPRRVDRVIVDALKARESIMRARAKRASNENERQGYLDQAAALKNSAGSARATFDSILADRFAKDARVQGATISFWKQWMALTEDTPKLLEKNKAKRIFVLGEWDLQLSPNDKKRVEALAKDHTYLLFDKADHHLLRRDALDPALMKVLLDALSESGSAPKS